MAESEQESWCSVAEKMSSTPVILQLMLSELWTLLSHFRDALMSKY